MPYLLTVRRTDGRMPSSHGTRRPLHGEVWQVVCWGRHQMIGRGENLFPGNAGKGDDPLRFGCRLRVQEKVVHEFDAASRF